MLFRAELLLTLPLCEKPYCWLDFLITSFFSLIVLEAILICPLLLWSSLCWLGSFGCFGFYWWGTLLSCAALSFSSFIALSSSYIYSGFKAFSNATLPSSGYLPTSSFCPLICFCFLGIFEPPTSATGDAPSLYMLSWSSGPYLSAMMGNEGWGGLTWLKLISC